MQKLVIGALIAIAISSFGAIAFLKTQLNTRGEQLSIATDLLTETPQKPLEENAIVTPPDTPEKEKVEQPVSSSIKQAEKKPAETFKSTTQTKVVPSSVPVADAPFKFDPAWRDAVVNLYCPQMYSDNFTSGSGVIIDPRGIILTNAHVASEFLFYDTPKIQSLIDCRVLTLSGVYRAKLMYLPEQFVDETLANIGKYVPEEDIILGQHDYALLYITKTYDPYATFPTAFQYLSLDAGPLPLPGSPLYIAGYPASFLGSIAIAKGLQLMVSPAIVDSIGSIKNSSTLDTLVFKSVTSGQHGSSGGAVVREGGRITAIPSFFNEEGETTGDSILSAITIEYVNRDMKTITGFTLQEFINRDTPKVLMETFLQDQAPGLHKKYVDAYAKLNTKGTIWIVPGGY